MYRQRLKQKAILLIFMTGFLAFLLAGGAKRTKEPQGQEGEKLEIPKDEEAEEPKEIWVMPGADASIRVLILGDGGSIYHSGRELDKEYPGELNYYEEEQGIVIVNEVPLEDYLKRVVPSEMPSRYEKEALKAQAVCARTYAVWHMQEYAYPEYEAHVDDSTSYQVYNNIESQESTDMAVEETSGQIMLYEDVPVKAYYFSTSCGTTTDETIWEKGDKNNTPYIAGRRVNDSGKLKDLTDEEIFAEFIGKKHADDLEILEPWYRWSCYVSLTRIRSNVERWAKERAARTADGILLKDGENYVWPDTTDIGEIREVQMIERNTGGAAQQMLLIGESGTLKIKYEYNIRLMLGIPGGEILKNDDTVSEGGNLLPSGYFTLEPVEQEGKLMGYQIWGGGLGHGAGMSQNGARLLAEQGSTYDEILQYFYQGIRLARLE